MDFTHFMRYLFQISLVEEEGGRKERRYGGTFLRHCRREKGGIQYQRGCLEWPLICSPQQTYICALIAKGSEETLKVGNYEEWESRATSFYRRDAIEPRFHY
jgi:hypothetical protein